MGNKRFLIWSTVFPVARRDRFRSVKRNLRMLIIKTLHLLSDAESKETANRQ